MRDRGWRRATAGRLARRRYEAFLADALWAWLDGAETRDRAVGAFRRRGGTSCDCRRRRHGNPKLGMGVCQEVGWRAAVVERIRGRREERWILSVVREGGSTAAEEVDPFRTRADRGGRVV